MDRAINKTTQKVVSAFEVYKNGSYQNLDRGEWIAPKDKLDNWEQIDERDRQVHYTKEKEFTNYNGTKVWCAPHFAVYPGSAAITTISDPTHKLLEDWLFSRLKEDDLEIIFARGVKPHKYNNKYKLSDLNINWNDYSVEVTTRGIKKLRADILLPFNTKHPLLGEGIIFEIQISNQIESVTYDRTIGRALHGYSTCWLFEKDFIIEKNNISLKNNNLIVNSFSEQMHYAKKEFVGKLKDIVEEQCRFLDEKIDETLIHIEKLEQKKKEIYENIDNQIKSNLENINIQLKNISDNHDKKMNEKEKAIINSIKRIEDNPFNAIIDSYKIELNNQFKKQENELEGTYKLLVNGLVEQNGRLKSNYEYWLAEMKKPKIIGQCYICNQGIMTLKKGKYGDFYGCSRYPTCQNTIKLKSVNYGQAV
jgi:hypothetical protein